MATREREEVSRILLLLATGEIQTAEALSRLNNWLVIKVDRDLPDIPFKGQTRRILLQLGCGFFEPLKDQKLVTDTVYMPKQYGQHRDGRILK